MKKNISIVIPIFNESNNIVSTYDSINNSLKKNSKYSYEIIMINDGSTDETASIASGLSSKTVHTKYIEFSRNFGKEAATSAGLQYATGDAAIMLDADGQHPIEIINSFIQKWEDGYDVVIGIRESNKGEGFIKKYGSRLFYKILSIISDGNTVPNSTDFRLIDRKVIAEFNKLTERGRMTRGLIDWLGFKRAYILFSANERIGSNASYSISKLSRLALHAFVSQSTKPLQAVGVLGIVVTLSSLILGLFLFIEQYMIGDPLNLAVTGTAYLAVFISVLVGIMLACQGLLALYIESIHNESQNRPLYVVAKSIEH